MKVTANQVTFGRLILMPCLCAGLYGSPTVQVITIALGMLLATTDFVDGYLARKYGPTVLGGLMDPIADKVFIAVTFLPYVDRGLVPWWAVAALFLREFVITAIRSSFEVRQRTLKTSYLAKVKTWVQMASIFVLLLLPVLSRTLLLALFITSLNIAILALLLSTLVFRRRRWRGVFIFIAFFVIGIAVFVFAGTRIFSIALFSVALAFTWASGLDYLSAGARELSRHPSVRAFDAVRLLGAVALPIVAVYVLVVGAAPAWAIIPIVAIELSHGGLDNLLAHHEAAAPAWSWGGRLAAVVGLLVLAIVQPGQAVLWSACALAASTAGTAAEFVRGRRYYLDSALREKKTAPAGA